MATGGLLVTAGAAPATPASGKSEIFANTTKHVSSIDDAGNVLSGPTIRENETIAVVPKQSSGTSASPSGNVSTTEKAMGLGSVSGFTITPQVTGNVVVWIGGMALNSTAAGDGTNITGRYGTGTAPANGDTAGLGTAFGIVQHFVASTTAGQQGFIVMGRITGLSLNTAVWFDLSLLAVTAGGSTVKDVQIVVFEI